MLKQILSPEEWLKINSYDVFQKHTDKNRKCVPVWMEEYAKYYLTVKMKNINSEAIFNQN